MSHQDSEDMDSYGISIRPPCHVNSLSAVSGQDRQTRHQVATSKESQLGIYLLQQEDVHHSPPVPSCRYKQTRDELSGAKQSEIFSRIATMWREMTDEQKEPYVKEVCQPE